MSHPVPPGQRRSNRIAGLPPSGNGQLQHTNDINHTKSPPMLEPTNESPAHSDLSYSTNTFTPTNEPTPTTFTPSPIPNVLPPQLPPPPYQQGQQIDQNQTVNQGTIFHSQVQPNQQFVHYPTNEIPSFTTQFYQTAVQDMSPQPINHQSMQQPSTTTSFTNLPSSNIPPQHNIPHPSTSAQLQQMRNEYNQQLRALEQRFQHQLQQTTQQMSHNIVESLSTTIRNTLSLQHQSPSVTSTTSSISDLIDLQTNKPKSVTFQNNNTTETQSTNVTTPVSQVPSAPTHHTSNTDFQQIIKSIKPEVKLQFQTFKPSADYELWKDKCILKTSMHETHNTLVKEKPNGELDFNPAMNQKQSAMLFLVTHDALGQEAQKLYGSINMRKPNGIELWKLLDKHYLNIDTSVTNQETLAEEFASIRREYNEDYSSFGIRFAKKYHQLVNNKVQVPTEAKNLAYKLLRAMNEPVLNEKILMDFHTKHEWFINLTLVEVAMKAKQYMTQYHSLMGSDHKLPPVLKPNPIQAPTPKPKPRPAPNPAPAPAPDPSPPANPNVSPPPATAPAPAPRIHRPVDQAEAARIVSILRNGDKSTYLTQLKLQTPRKFYSIETKNACSTVGCYNIWQNIANPPPVETCPAPVPAPPTQAAVRRAQTNAAHNANQAAHSQQILNGLLGQQGQDLLDELSEIEEEEEINIANNNNNTSIDPYLPFVTNVPPHILVAKDKYITNLRSKLLQQRRRRFHSFTRSPASNPTALCRSVNNKPSTPLNTLPTQQGHRVVADSGATHFMSGISSLFESISFYNPTDSNIPKVMLGDESTFHPVKGYGFVNYTLNGNRIRHQALYIPALGKTSLLSVKQHVQWRGNYFHAEANSATIAFPTATIDFDVNDEIESIIQPSSHSNQAYTFDEETAVPCNPKSTSRVSFNLVSRQVKSILQKSPECTKFSDTVTVMKISPTAILPKRASKQAAGYDVTAITSITINPGEITKVPTGLATALPLGIYLRIAPRSSLSLHHLTVEGGVVDGDYRGEIKVLMKNNGTSAFTINTGDRIAQFIFEKYASPLLELHTHLPTTTRDKGGFGSTNITNNRRSKFEVFRLNQQEILLMDNSRPNRPRARRMHVPLSTPNPFEVQTPLPSKPPRELTPINIMEFNSKHSTPLHPALDVVFEPIPPTTEPLEPETAQPPLATPLPVDTVNSALPKRVTMSRDFLHRAIGFQNSHILIKNIHKLGDKSVQIQNLPRSDTIDIGETASIKSNRRNTTPSKPPSKYGDIWHMDIGYGPTKSIGGAKYTLLLIDKATRYKFIYGLKNLTTSLLDAVKKFLRDCAVIPTLIRTDFDDKLLGGDVGKLLLEHKIQVEGAPPYRQHQNGLVERHWQTMVNMARNWLTSSMLPSSYWYFAIKRACEVTNLLPVLRNGKLTTPYELVYHKKVPYRSLIPMFSIAYIKQERENGQSKNSWSSKSLKCILVGKCDNSDSLLFHHPPSKQTLSCAEGYKFDVTTPAGQHFGETFDNALNFNTRGAMDAIHRPPSHEENQTVFIKGPDTNTYLKAKVLSVPIDDDNENYTIQESNSGDIKEIMAHEIFDHDPTIRPTDAPTATPFPQFPWINHNEKATLYLQESMPKPKRGKFHHNKSNNEWSFIPGHNGTNEPIPLPHFHLHVESMITNKKLFKGWITAAKALTARRTRATSNLIANLIVLRKVSAKNLRKMEATTLLKHHKLHPEDKLTWDAAYLAEYDGLRNIDTWEEISEDDYNASKHIFGSLLPTMAISTIKYNGNGEPERAKYRIVALGNLDPHSWSKNDCFAPVLSQMELRLLTAIAARHRCIPKTGDVSQAFCQSYLPKGENYVMRPPPGCPITKSKTYLRLKKTLYGLKRSPRHFYNLAVKHLTSIGLTQHPSSPCIFHGVLIENEPPIYLGLYVDDFIYFSESPKVEEKFEKEFGNKMPMEFNGKINYFLGINFNCKRHEDGNVSILLNQEAFVDALVLSTKLDGEAVNIPRTPYRSGYPVDTIPQESHTEEKQHSLNHLLRVLVGSLNWLALSTRPDIATITNILAKYSSKAATGHIEAAKRVVKYLKGTKQKGILFSSKDRNHLQSFIKFPIPQDNVVSLCDSNWGPQDQSKPHPDRPQELDLFKTRSISGHIIWLGGPVHWTSKRQTITARSSAEAEIYATDECTKQLIQLSFILDDLPISLPIMTLPSIIYNDNSACVCWSKATTTKGLRYVQIRENAIRESVESDFISVRHIEGKVNLADIFTKEDRDAEHFISIRDLILHDSVDCNL
jgi:deoxyuridine 5'-triphosphate nucleotidohydrolase